MPEDQPVRLAVFPPEVITKFEARFGHELNPFFLTRTEAEWLSDALDTAMHPRKAKR